VPRQSCRRLNIYILSQLIAMTWLTMRIGVRRLQRRSCSLHLASHSAKGFCRSHR
jgi:hypothetical protein